MPSTRGSTPPQTLEPPPKGVSEAPTVLVQSITAKSPLRCADKATTSGAQL